MVEWPNHKCINCGKVALARFATFQINAGEPNPVPVHGLVYNYDIASAYPYQATVHSHRNVR